MASWANVGDGVVAPFKTRISTSRELINKPVGDSEMSHEQVQEPSMWSLGSLSLCVFVAQVPDVCLLSALILAKTSLYPRATSTAVIK